MRAAERLRLALEADTFEVERKAEFIRRNGALNLRRGLPTSPVFQYCPPEPQPFVPHNRPDLLARIKQVGGLYRHRHGAPALTQLRIALTVDHLDLSRSDISKAAREALQ